MKKMAPEEVRQRPRLGGERQQGEASLCGNVEFPWEAS